MINADRIVTISLEENHARRASTEAELAKLSLHTDFHLAQRDRGHEERGCFNSHLAVCKEALQAGCQSLIVFEDDVRILAFTGRQITAVNQFIRENSFEVLYLGLIISKMWFCWRKAIVRAKGSGAHAYVLSRQGMEKLAAYEYRGIPIDKVFKHDFTCHSVYPIIAEQHAESTLSSDISPWRNTVGRKNHDFWSNNFRRQKWLPWKNLHKTLMGA